MLYCEVAFIHTLFWLYIYIWQRKKDKESLNNNNIIFQLVSGCAHPQGSMFWLKDSFLRSWGKLFQSRCNVVLNGLGFYTYIILREPSLFRISASSVLARLVGKIRIKNFQVQIPRPEVKILPSRLIWLFLLYALHLLS